MDEEHQQRDEEDREAKHGRHHWKSAKFRSFLGRYKAKEKLEKQNTVKPLPAPVRMSKKFTRTAEAPVLRRKFKQPEEGSNNDGEI